jgi:hypothetical protein
MVVCGVPQQPGLVLCSSCPPLQAYTSQIIALTMMALQLAEDSIAKREKRDTIIDELGRRRGWVGCMASQHIIVTQGWHKDKRSISDVHLCAC